MAMKRFPKSVELYDNCVVDGNHPVVFEAARGFFVAGQKVEVNFSVIEKTLEKLKQYFSENNKTTIDINGLEQLTEFFYEQCLSHDIDERLAKQITLNAAQAYAKFENIDCPELQNLKASSGRA